ncbi:DivIVA domain-containing protein [Lactococcus kimchii]|uniref:DivIVA domain-containing protein n=1 Tax=Lactococcus sp. S-13 TaxID=2507158 RepID=UPI0010233EDD|nr:DivIVA domain-containing protein [Lactococcus sp. S-13]RZI49916.1 DivIVA domain-containing protein [Lactococcus sp. S-13]
MTLNSLDVQNKSFNPQFRGFSKHEVDEFLDIVVRDYDEFAQTIKDQERELKSLRERVKYFDDMKDSLNKSIVVAQDAADNLREQAKGEADKMKINSEKESSEIIANAGRKSALIIEAAKKEAGFILNAASDDARKLVRDTDDLKRKMRLYHQRMTSVVENQLASMQSDDWAEIFRPTRDYAVNPEEKLQSIIEEHLESAEETLAKTQAITPLTDEDVANATEEVKETEEVSEAEAPKGQEALTDAENADETVETPVEATQDAENSLTQTSTDSQATYEEFPELTSQEPEVSNSMDNQETIDLSELKN